MLTDFREYVPPSDPPEPEVQFIEPVQAQEMIPETNTSDEDKRRIAFLEREVKRKERTLEVKCREIEELESEVSKTLSMKTREIEQIESKLHNKIRTQNLQAEAKIEKLKAQIEMKDKKIQALQKDKQKLKEKSKKKRIVAGECCVCLDRDASHCFGCGHRICKPCGKQLKRESKTCPQCRQKIEVLIKVIDQ